DIAAEGVEVGRIILEPLRVIRRVHAGGERALGDAGGGYAVVRLVTHAELQVLPGAVIDLVVAVDLRPLFRVSDVDVLGTEYPAEGDRNAAGSRRRVDGVAKIEVGRTAEPVELISSAAA